MLSAARKDNPHPASRRLGCAGRGAGRAKDPGSRSQQRVAARVAVLRLAPGRGPSVWTREAPRDVEVRRKHKPAGFEASGLAASRRVRIPSAALKAAARSATCFRQPNGGIRSFLSWVGSGARAQPHIGQGSPSARVRKRPAVVPSRRGRPDPPHAPCGRQPEALTKRRGPARWRARPGVAQQQSSVRSVQESLQPVARRSGVPLATSFKADRPRRPNARMRTPLPSAGGATRCAGPRSGRAARRVERGRCRRPRPLRRRSPAKPR